MKTLYIKTAIISCIAVILSVNLSAQNYVTFQSDARETIDSVTVGSRMPYRMAGDADIAALETSGVMDPSIFKWQFSPSLTILNFAGTAATPAPGGETDYYEEKVISVVMPITVQTITLTVNEKSQPKVGTGCEGTDSVAHIQVVARPTLAWPGTSAVGGCVATAVDILLTLTGYRDWIVTYNIAYTPYATGSPTTTTTGQTATIGNNRTMSIPASVFPNEGKYEITVTNLTDRISRKSLDQTLVAATAADIPSTPYTVHVYPTPDTKKLEHVRNF
ncbi:MAG: hypothetical protein LBS09_01525 [Bacteroidales bacterium]|nr:hypothetical protein [Bacteroidales bacterium]